MPSPGSCCLVRHRMANAVPPVGLVGQRGGARRRRRGCSSTELPVTGLAASSASLSADPSVGTTNQMAEPPFVELDRSRPDLAVGDDESVRGLTGLGGPEVTGRRVERAGAGDLGGVSAVIADVGRALRDRGLADHLVGAVEVVEGDGQRVVRADLRLLRRRTSMSVSGLKPPRMAFSLVVTVGSPKAKPASVRPKLAGWGRPAGASSPKTRPENQRLVGGMSPSASRLIGSSFGVFLTMSASSGSICCLVTSTWCRSGRAYRSAGPDWPRVAQSARPTAPWWQPVRSRDAG